MSHVRGHAGAKKVRDYADTPLNVYWETTQACSLACRHCRAAAMPCSPPGELTEREALAFVRSLTEFGDPLPHLILTGGDPLMRPDLLTMIDVAIASGLEVSVTPSATPRLTRERLEELKAHGVTGLGLSLDGPSAARHDAIRGVNGCFARTIEAAGWARELELPLQINTLVARETLSDLGAVRALVEQLGVARWSLFFLVAVGRGRVLEPITAPEAEKVLAWLYQEAQRAPFVVATTEAPFFRRVVHQLSRTAGGTGMRGMPLAPGAAVRDGHGVVFVSSMGEIWPAGFLPVAAGNVKHDSIVDVYRNAPLFRRLHAVHSFEGRCGHCEYRGLCGGSRARAYAATQDPCESDPLCVHEPRSAAE